MKIGKNSRARLVIKSVLNWTPLFGFLLMGFGPRPGSHEPIFFPFSNQQRMTLDQSYGKVPLAFEPNLGFTDSQVQYLSHGRGYALFLTSGGEAVLALRKPHSGPSSKLYGGKRKKIRGAVFRTFEVVLRMKLEGVRKGVAFVGLAPFRGISNYYIGNDPSKWRTNVPQYAEVKAQGIYPGVDMVYYGNQRHLEYDFVVRPGADPNVIHLRFEGIQTTSVNVWGDLELGIEGGKIIFKSPKVYQESGGLRKEIKGRYRVGPDGGIRFEVKAYNKSEPLVIDPQLDYSTYLAGTSLDAGYGIAANGGGNAFVTGITLSTDFPTTSGVYQPNDPSAGFDDAFITELNPAGTGLIYSTYFGGNNHDGGSGIAVNGNNAFVIGTTLSSDFPTTSGAIQISDPSVGNKHAFVVELNSSGGLVYSTYLGGSSVDYGQGIAVNGSGNAYVTGYTASSNFPTTSGAYQTNKPAGGNPTFVAELNHTGGLIYSTLLGGNSIDTGWAIALDGSGNAYITGTTYSTNFPTTSGAFQSADPNTADSHVFFTELNPTGTGLVYSTYLGGNSTDVGNGIAQVGGNVYLAGYTDSTNFPTTSGAYQTTMPSGGEAVFVAKLNSLGVLVYLFCQLPGCKSSGPVYAIWDISSFRLVWTLWRFQRSCWAMATA